MLPVLEIRPWEIGAQPFPITQAIAVAGARALQPLLRVGYPPAEIAHGLLLPAPARPPTPSW